MRVASTAPRIRQAAVMLYLLLGSLFLLSAPAAPAQTRVNDRDMEALIRNLNNDSKAFRQQFDSAIQKSVIRKTTREKDDRKLVATFVQQTDGLVSRFKKDRNGAAAFTTVMNTAEQIDATVNSVPLGPRVDGQWQKVRAEIRLLAAAYNMPASLGNNGSGNTLSSGFAATPAILPPPSAIRSPWLRISAFATTPLAGADVAVYDMKGKRIFERKNATNDRGVYPAMIDNLPRDFRVTVSADGARLKDADLQAMGKFTLSADARNFDPTYGVVYVNPVTTLASRVADKLPQHDLAAAEDRVRRLLVLPPGASLGAAMRQGPYYRSPYFSETEFFRRARQRGGFDRLESGLTSEAVSDRPVTDPFSAGRAGPAIAAAKFIGTNLASGALNWLGGAGIGWIIGSGGEPAPPGATKEDIEKLQASLEDLQGSVDLLSRDLAQLTREIKAALTKNNYLTAVQPATTLAGQVENVESNVTNYADTCPPIIVESDRKFLDYCTKERKMIERQLGESAIDGSFGTLASYMVDNPAGGRDGMIHLYSQSMGESKNFFRPADSTKMQEMFDYWESVQTEGANLKVERWHLNGAQNKPETAKPLLAFLGNANAYPVTLGTFQNTLAAEGKLMYPPVPEGTVVHTSDKTMWLIQPIILAPGKNGGPSVVCNAPPKGDIYIRPMDPPTVVEVRGLRWNSPTLAQAKSLAAGRTEGSLSQWLTENTRAVAPNTPTSPGFPDYLIKRRNDCNGQDTGENAWTGEFTGKDQVVNGIKYRVYYSFDLRSGKILDTVITFNSNWLLMDRELKAGEQYYWYP